MVRDRMIAWVSVLILTGALASCSAAGPSASGAPAQSGSSNTPAATAGGDGGGTPDDGDAAGCPDTVFATYADLADVAEAQPEPIAQALGVTLPSVPTCTITWTDGDGKPSFTMFWKGADYLDTQDALIAALTTAGFQKVQSADPSTTGFRKGDISDLAVVARDPSGSSKLPQAMGGPVAVMYGPDVRG